MPLNNIEIQDSPVDESENNGPRMRGGRAAEMRGLRGESGFPSPTVMGLVASLFLSRPVPFTFFPAGAQHRCRTLSRRVCTAGRSLASSGSPKEALSPRKKKARRTSTARVLSFVKSDREWGF